MKTMKEREGFTLIELLVVIAIIGLLSTLSVLALNQARARSRDARRIADIKQIQTALEMYYNDWGGYPANITSPIGSGTNNVYMKVVPTPPTPADNAACASTVAYTYAAANWLTITNGTYTLQYCLGNATGGVPAGLNTATPAGISIQ